MERNPIAYRRAEVLKDLGNSNNTLRVRSMALSSRAEFVALLVVLVKHGFYCRRKLVLALKEGRNPDWRTADANRTRRACFVRKRLVPSCSSYREQEPSLKPRAN